METNKNLKECIQNMEVIAKKDKVSQTDIIYLIAYASKILYKYDKLVKKLEEKEEALEEWQSKYQFTEE